MTKGFRTFLFWFFLLAFAIGAPAIALYAQGYRLNWPIESGKKLIVKTGGFFVKAHPKQISVYVNGKMEKQTDFFFDSALITDLMPRRHLIEIKKNGYQSWSKNLEIREKEVAEAKNVFLFPEELKFSAVEQNIADFLISNDRQKTALIYQDEIGWGVKLHDIRRGVTTKLAAQNNFSLKDPEFAGWEWISAQTLEVATKSKTGAESYLIATDKIPPQIIKKPAADMVPTATATSTQEIKELATAEINGATYFLASDGMIYKKENGAKDAAPAGKAKIDIAGGSDADYDLWQFGDYFFVRAGDQLLSAKKDAAAFEKILDDAPQGIKIAPNGKKIVYWSNSEIWVFYLENKTDPPAARAGDKIFIARFSEKITACDWFNSDYLIFLSGDLVKTAEIDPRDKINFADLGRISAIAQEEKNDDAKMFFDQSKKIVYLLANNTLRKSDPIE